MLVPIVLVAIVIFLLLSATLRRPKNFPPGPRPVPIFGNYLQISSKDLLLVSEAFYNEYGGLTGLLVPLHKIVIVNSWDALKELFSNEDCQGRPDVCLSRDRFEEGNYGVLMTEGESWKKQKHFTLQKFRDLGFGRNGHEALIAEEAQALIKEIAALNGKAHFYEDMFYLANINITWGLLSGCRYDYHDAKLRLLVKSIKEVIHDIKVFGSIASVFPWLRYIFPQSTGYKSIKNGSKFIRTFSQKAIDEHKRTRDPSLPGRDFLDIYLQEIDKSSNNAQADYSEKELVGICMDLLLAGSDTSSGHLGFAILFLCIRNDVQDRIYEEILQNIGPEDQVTMADKPKFVYTEAFLMEVARFRPVVPCFAPHRATRETTLGGYNIPKGTILFPIVTGVFFDELYWGDPKNFRPERFIKADGKLKKEERLIPFGKGKRSCIGETVSKMSTFLLLTSLVQKFHFRLPEGSNTDTKGIPGFTYSPPSYKTIATPRYSKE